MAMPKVDGWNAVYLDNHDSGRSLSRYASDAPEHRATAAKMLATYMMTLSGTPFLLAGQEIGMANLGREYGLDAYIDVEGRNRYNEIRGDPSAIDDFMRELQLKSRDHGRLPMQWDDSAHAGFTTADEPWMTVNRDYPEWNVAAQVDDPSSVMAFWKKMIALRKEYKELFVYGGYRPLDEEYTGEMVLGYVRESRSETAVVLLNFSDVEQMVGEEYQHYTVLVNESCRVDGRAILSPFGALVLYSRT
jgi:alpha-glucosidase